MTKTQLSMFNPTQCVSVMGYAQSMPRQPRTAMEWNIAVSVGMKPATEQDINKTSFDVQQQKKHADCLMSMNRNMK